MVSSTRTSNDIPDLLRLAIERAEALSGAPTECRRTERWAYEAANVGDLTVLASLALLSD